MTNTVIMEELSKSYLETIANRTGYFNSTSRDYGTDLTIRKAFLCPTRNRYLTSGKALDIQIKAVLDKYVPAINDPAKPHIKFRLEVKNYNDLIDRCRENGRTIPLLLVVFVLPSEMDHWLGYSENELILKRCAYWYQVPVDAVYADNKTKSTITIPKENRVTMEFFNDQFAALD